MIAIGLLAALSLDNRRKCRLMPPPLVPPKPLRRYGVLWDEEPNLLCPADQTLLKYFGIEWGRQHESLTCPMCKTNFGMRDDWEAKYLGITEAKRRVKDELTSKQV